MTRLAGKVAVITGGSSGIGLATARLFAEQGATVFIAGRRRDALLRAVDEIGPSVFGVEVDVASIGDLDRLYADVRAKAGAVDIVVANAGMVGHAPLASASIEHFDQMFAVNTRGVFFTVQKAMPIMRAGGSVIIISSGMHLKGAPGCSAYSASKAALRSFVRTWASEYKGADIRFNMLSPGVIDTPLIDQLFTSAESKSEATQGFVDLIPLGRMGRPDEVARAVLFLASDDSRYCTGIDLLVDGGLTGV